MKGTLFSTDFVKDFDGNLRILEANTDTSFTSAALSQVDFADLKTLLTDSQITELHLVYKSIQEDFVSAVTDYFVDSGITVSKTLVSLTDIYPPTVEDSPSKFILRCAYDESAIFDSTYCKSANELLKLYSDNESEEKAAQFYIKTPDGTLDKLVRVANGENIPDVAVKDLENIHLPIKFYKLSGVGSIEEQFTSFLENIGENKVVLNYYNNDSEPVHKSLRSFNILYGDNLEVLNLINLEVEALLEKPTLLDVKAEDGSVDEKHYYELTSNHPKASLFGEKGGIFEDEEITDVSGSGVKVSEAVIGESYKAFNIDGSPDSDNSEVYNQWFSEGSDLASTGTTSVLINKIERDLVKKSICHVKVDGQSAFRSNLLQSILIYDKVRGGYTYEYVYNIDPNKHQLVKLDSTLVDISSNEVEILEGEHKTYTLDLEQADTFLLHNSELNLKVVAHNCFPAGTKILLKDGESINIEDVVADQHELLTFNEVEKTFNSGKVGSIRKTIQNTLIKIVTEEGEIKTTPGHKFYSQDGANTWRPAAELKVGDTLLTKGAKEVLITELETLQGEFEVYHLIDVKDDHTYFADNLLVHNFKGTLSCFPAGTEILLSNGDIKNIEDVSVGEDVLTVNEVTGEKESKPVYEILTPIHNDLVKVVLEDGTEVVSTLDHPYYTEGLKIKSNYPEKTNAVYNIGKPVTKLEVGDKCIKEDGSLVKVISIELQEEVETQTYLLRVEDNHNYFANSILVHNK